MGLCLMWRTVSLQVTNTNMFINRLDGKPNILVDDKPDNIKRWNDVGGIGILYQANEDSVDVLIKELKKVF